MQGLQQAVLEVPAVVVVDLLMDMGQMLGMKS